MSIGGDGTVFELSPPIGKSTQWTEQVLYSFRATSEDGQLPYGSLIFDKWGNLYGTTNAGGATAGDATSPFFGLAPVRFSN